MNPLRIGSPDKGKILGCLPLCLAEVIWGSLYSIVAGLALYNYTLSITHKGDYSTAIRVLDYIFGAVNNILIIGACLSCLVVAFFTWIIDLKPVKLLTLIQVVALLVNMVIYIVKSCNDIFCDGCIAANSSKIVFYITIVADGVIMCSAFFMMQTHNSLEAVRRLSGTGWEKLCAEELVGTTRRNRHSVDTLL